MPGLAAIAAAPGHGPGKRTLHPDVADPTRMLALEAEGFAWHGDKRQLTRDCRRYNALHLLGWLVIRFSWTQVMLEPAYVHQVLRALVPLTYEHANVA